MKQRKEDDVWYQVLRGRCLAACAIINHLAGQQAVDKELLKMVTSDLRAKEIRHRLAERRRGQNGLRKLNKDISRFYRYCEKMGY